MASNKKIIANTSFSQRVFSSVQEVLQAYSISYPKLQRLLQTGQTLEDGKTTFDEFLDPENSQYDEQEKCRV